MLLSVRSPGKGETPGDWLMTNSHSHSVRCLGSDCPSFVPCMSSTSRAAGSRHPGQAGANQCICSLLDGTVWGCNPVSRIEQLSPACCQLGECASSAGLPLDIPRVMIPQEQVPLASASGSIFFQKQQHSTQANADQHGPSPTNCDTGQRNQRNHQMPSNP